jgi:Protein of unknown function (DUF3768)
MTPTPTCARIAELNDQFRTTTLGGTIFVTAGVRRRGSRFASACIAAAVCYDGFTEENDPLGLRDMGAFDMGGQQILWRIDCYDPSLRFPSPNPADPQRTGRVLTLMVPEEF